MPLVGVAQESSTRYLNLGPVTVMPLSARLVSILLLLVGGATAEAQVLPRPPTDRPPAELPGLPERHRAPHRLHPGRGGPLAPWRRAPRPLDRRTAYERALEAASVDPGIVRFYDEAPDSAMIRWAPGNVDPGMLFPRPSERSRRAPRRLERAPGLEPDEGAGEEE